MWLCVSWTAYLEAQVGHLQRHHEPQPPEAQHHRHVQLRRRGGRGRAEVRPSEWTSFTCQGGSVLRGRPTARPGRVEGRGKAGGQPSGRPAAKRLATLRMRTVTSPQPGHTIPVHTCYTQRLATASACLHAQPNCPTRTAPPAPPHVGLAAPHGARLHEHLVVRGGYHAHAADARSELAQREGLCRGCVWHSGKEVGEARHCRAEPARDYESQLPSRASAPPELLLPCPPRRPAACACRRRGWTRLAWRRPWRPWLARRLAPPP